MTVHELASDLVAGGPPLFFPQPTVEVRYNFDQGNPASETFPLEELARCEQKVRDQIGGSAFDYFDADTGYEELVFGWRGLRALLAKRFAARDGRDLSADNLILTSGSVQGISLVARAFLNAGDVVYTEAVTFPYAVRFFESVGAEVRPIRLDHNGLVIGDLRAAIREDRAAGKRPKLVYTIPTFQLPTGSCMPLSHREELVAMAHEENVLIHEDNVYAALRYEGESQPTLFSLDRNDVVIQSDSFSKTVAPSLRLGWVTGPAPAIAALGAVRQDLGVSQFTARVMADYVGSGDFDRHVADVRVVYKAKRDAAVAALREHCAEWIDFRVPEGSFFLWLALSDRIDWDLAAANVVNEGVFCRPGERFSGSSDASQFLRMAFSNVSIPTIEQGIEALGRALRTSRKS